MNSNVLLLTATITPPPGVPNLVRTHPQARYTDYIRAFNFYLSHFNRLPGDTRMVWVENSNSDISEFFSLVEQANLPDKVELLRFNGLGYPGVYGRAYGEFSLIEYAMAHSRTLKEVGTQDVVWKISGRYIIKNFTQLISRQPEEFDIYCNFRTGISRPAFKRLRWGDMYLMAWTTKGYSAAIKGMAEKLREDLISGSPEMRFRQLIEQVSAQLIVIPRFNTVPEVDVIRGFDGLNPSQGKQRLKYYFRRVSLRLFPWLWV